MLIHDFGIVGEKKDVHLHDDLILYMIDTFEWIKTFSELESNIEKNGLNHAGITYFKGESVTKLKNIILHWINIFSLGEDVIELRGMYYINIGKHSYTKITDEGQKIMPEVYKAWHSIFDKIETLVGDQKYLEETKEKFVEFTNIIENGKK